LRANKHTPFLVMADTSTSTSDLATNTLLGSTDDDSYSKSGSGKAWNSVERKLKEDGGDKIEDSDDDVSGSEKPEKFDDPAPLSPDLRKQKDHRNSKAFLMEVGLGHFVAAGGGKKNRLVFAKSTTSTRDALALLTRNRIISIPVWDEATREFTAFLSVLDLIRFSNDEDPKSPRGCLPVSRPGPTLAEVVAEVGEEEAVQIDMWGTDTAVTTIMEWFTMGIHRVICEDETAAKHSPAGHVVSQSDVVSYINDHLSLLTPIVRKTIDEHAFLDKDTPSIGATRQDAVQSTASMAHLLERLYSDRTSAIPVVDSDNRLIGSFSATDLRGMTGSELSKLRNQTVQHVISRQGANHVTCERSATLERVINLLSKHRTHRVWVVNPEQRLEGLVTLTDVLCKFAPFDYKLLHSRKI